MDARSTHGSDGRDILHETPRRGGCSYLSHGFTSYSRTKRYGGNHEIADFPGLSWLAASPEDALKGIRSTVRKCVKDLVQTGESVPQAITTKKFSGKFMVRVPPELHRQLAVKAAEEGVSLNRVVSSKLAQSGT